MKPRHLLVYTPLIFWVLYVFYVYSIGSEHAEHDEAWGALIITVVVGVPVYILSIIGYVLARVRGDSLGIRRVGFVNVLIPWLLFLIFYTSINWKYLW